MQLTSHERIMRIFRGQPIDRPALKLWGAGLAPDDLLHPAYAPVCRLAREKTDLMVAAGSPFDPYCGKLASEHFFYTDVPTEDPLWLARHTRLVTPGGELHAVDAVSTVKEPGYTLEHLVKEPEDLEKVLSLPYEPYPFDPAPFFELQRRVGDRGVAMFALDHAGYALHRLMGSETLAYFSVDCRPLLEEALALFAARIRAQAKEAIEAGIAAPYQWVGPEVFIPPLASPRDFEDFVYRFDKPLCDDIHNAGGHVWLHCHGKVANFMERYIQMGVDILNPLEPPKNGDVHMDAIVKKFGGRIGLEGNIEIQDILLAGPEELKALIRECVEMGAESGRFILCPSAGFMEYPFPTHRYIENLKLYINYGHACVEACRR